MRQETVPKIAVFLTLVFRFRSASPPHTPTVLINMHSSGAAYPSFGVSLNLQVLFFFWGGGRAVREICINIMVALVMRESSSICQ